MSYAARIPEKSVIATPRVLKHFASGYEDTRSSRSFYGDTDLKYGYFVSGSAPVAASTFTILGSLSDDTGHKDYENTFTTYNTGDYAYSTEHSMIFRYSGTDALVISSTADRDDFHPLKIDEYGERVNADIWTIYGARNRSKHIDGTTTTATLNSVDVANLESSGQSALWPVLQITGFTISAEAPCALFGIDADFVHFRSTDSFGTVLDEFVVNVKHKTSLYFGSDALLENVELTIIGKEALVFPSLPEEAIPSVSTFVPVIKAVQLGSQLYGHSSSRTTESKTVISDGIEKTMVTKSYDVFDGHVMVEEAKLQEAEYTLMKATQGDYVFHTGTGQELYDQRVYLGRIKYRSPIEHKGKYKIKISGQSLSYGVENPMIAPDSTDGAAI